MERYMYQDDSFERMLKQKSDEYRMYPSDKSWDSIHEKLHGPQKNFKWNILSAALVFFFSSISLFTSNYQHFTFSKLLTPKQVDDKGIASDKSLGVRSSVESVKISPKLSVAWKKESPEFAMNNENNLVPEASLISKAEVSTISEPVQTVQQTLQNLQPISENADADVTSVESFITKASQDYRLTDLNPLGKFLNIKEEQPVVSNLAVVPEEKSVEINELPENKSDADLNYEVKVPLATPKLPTKQIQFYLAPSISYRVLIADNQFTFGNFQSNPRNSVNHRSSIGFEAGAAFLLKASKRLTFKTGLQFNYTRYIVRASKFSPELTTVTLNSYNSIQRETNLRNSNGYLAEDLANETMQVSIPVGVDYTVARFSKFSINLAGTVQPSYLLKATGYLVTDNYKNYIKAPDLLSRMNLNTGFEMFIRWNAGPFQMQAGPQVRYQLFSNSQERYPIQEHLVDYGFKLGFIKPLR